MDVYIGLYYGSLSINEIMKTVRRVTVGQDWTGQVRRSELMNSSFFFQLYDNGVPSMSVNNLEGQ